MCRCTDEDLPVQKALIDGGSEVYCIKPDLVKHLSLSARLTQARVAKVRVSSFESKNSSVKIRVSSLINYYRSFVVYYFVDYKGVYRKSDMSLRCILF